jgi:peptidyl-prolyl cis-trans isomerase D
MGLKWLRDQFKHLKYLLWGVIAVFVLLVFVDWGTGRSGPSGGGGAAALQIGNREISEQEFLLELKRTRDRYQQIYGAQWEQVRDQLDLASVTAQQMIRRELMLREAERLGLRVSESEIQDEILAMPVFQKESGGFVGADLYQRVLRSNRMTAQQFEKSVAEDLLLGKLIHLMGQGAYVSDQEVEETLRREREVADLDMALLPYEEFLDEAVLDDAEVEAFYLEAGDTYRRSEQRVIRYLAIETNRLRRLLPAEDEDLQAYFDQHRDDYVASESARARHILFRFPPGADATARAEVELRAEQVAGMVRSGVDFAELAAKHSEDPATKDKGGDLGWFGRGRMVEAFDEAVFSAQPGDVLGPVESVHGLHVIQVEGFEASRQQELDEVRDQVRFAFLEGRAAAEAETRARALADRVAADPPTTDEQWQTLADEDEAVVLNISPAFSKGDVIPGIGSDLELGEEVFAAAPGDLGGARAVARGWVVWQLKDVLAEGIPPLDEVRNRVEQDLRRTRALAAASEAAEQLASQWRETAQVETLVESLGASVTPVTNHRRNTPFTGIGSHPDLDGAVFSATEGDVVGPVEVADRGAVVARVSRLVLVDAETLASELGPTRQRLAAQRGSQLLDSIIGERRRDVPVTVNNELIERFAPPSQG